MPWPGDIESVTITWMDSQQETYLCNTVEVLATAHVLRLSSVYKGSIGFSDVVKDERAFPLDNVRTYVVNRVEL